MQIFAAKQSISSLADSPGEEGQEKGGEERNTL
jgi:hypothetical protein